MTAALVPIADPRRRRPPTPPLAGAIQHGPMRTVIVTDHDQEWFQIPDAAVFTARHYLSEPGSARDGSVRVLNFCRTGRYQGRPLAAHLRLKEVRPEHFQRWLRLFRETAAEVCPGEVAVFFIDRAERIAESFQLGMFYRPDQDVPGQPGSFPPPTPAAGSDPA